MAAYRVPPIPGSEITPKSVYLRRRELMGLAAGGLALAASPSLAAPLTAKPSAYKVDEPLTPKDSVTSYNNFYEFGLDKDSPKALSGDFKPMPWTIKVDGLVSKPQTLDVAAMLTDYTIEERVYRMRCVEAWSMSFRGTAFRLPPSSTRSSRSAAPNMSPSKPSCARRKCRARRGISSRWNGPMSKACAWTRRATR